MIMGLTGATETSYTYLAEHYQFPDNVFVSHLPEQLKLSDSPYKILWAHHAFDQQLFLNFDHDIINHIVSPSEYNRQQFIRYHNVPEDKISVIPNGVADMFGFSNNKTKTMIYTSIPYKGLKLLEEIIPRIQKRHPDTKFKIFSSMSLYGDDQLDKFVDTYQQLKTYPNVEYSRAVPQEQLVSHYQESAFFIHPNTWEETFCVSMAEAMRCGAYPIITSIGAIAEVAGEGNASIVYMDGKPTNTGYEVTEDFINNFTDACCESLDIFDKQRQLYDEVSKNISNYVYSRYNWKSISNQWKTLIHNITGEQITMTTENNEQVQQGALTYKPIEAQQAVQDDDYLRIASENVFRWEQSDKEMAQGRTNFQLEKFIGLNTHNVSVTFEHILKERRIMASGYMQKLIDMRERVREFDYKWNGKDKSQPLVWEIGAGPGDGKRLCWFDIDELNMTHYLKSSELEIRDRLHQMEHMDKMMEKLVELNDGVIPTRAQFLEENEDYWDKRLAEQALDDLMASRTGISIGNIQAMRRASGPSMVDDKNELKEGYLPMDTLLTQAGRDEFVMDLQKKVLGGYEKITGKDLGYGNALKGKEESKKIEGNKEEPKGGYYTGEGFGK